MYQRAGAGEAVIASENFASAYGVHAGDVVELQAPGGPMRLPISGIVRDYSDQQGAILLDLSVYRRLWQDDSVDFFRVYVAPGTDPARRARAPARTVRPRAPPVRAVEP